MNKKTLGFIETQPQHFTEPAAAEPLNATWVTRALYCLGLLALFPGRLGQGSWVGLATGGGLLGWFGTSIFSLIVAGVIYRIYLVLRYSTSLSARHPNLFGRGFRVLGQLAMLLGAFGLIAIFLVKPLTLLFFESAGPNGIGYFVVGLYAVMVSSVGWIGCALFELSRVMGTKTAQPAAPKTQRQRKQDLAVGGLLIAVVVAAPHMARLAVGDPCYGPTMLRCMAKVDGGIKRVAIAPFGSGVRLESNIEEVVFVKQRKPRNAEAKENLAFSLLKSGHPAQDDGAQIRVAVDAASIDKGVRITLKVFDAQGESANFATTVAKNARLETGMNGKQNLILDTPSSVEWGTGSFANDSATQQNYLLDELFSQMRRSIATPLEQAEQSRRVERPVKELAVIDIPGRTKIDDAKPAESCRDILKLTRGGRNETALRPSPGWPLPQLRFLAAANADSYVLAQVNDRIGCNADGVWAYNYPAMNGEMEIRRYSNDGKLSAFVSAMLPIDRLHGAWADVESAKVEGNRITFSVVSIVKPGELKRRVFELAL